MVDSNAYLMVYGERGDTGKRLLKKIKTDAPEEETDEKAETNKVSNVRYFLKEVGCNIFNC